MVQIVTRDDKVYITGTAKQDIEVNIGTKLVLDNIAPIVCEVIDLEPTTPTITVKVIESNPVYSHFPEYFQENETILLTNSGKIIDAKSLSNTDKHRRIINYVKKYRNITITPRSLKPLTKDDNSWESDNSVDECYLCEKQFTVFTRKHHCRNCGKIICDDCSSQKIKFDNDTDAERVCDLCYSCSSNKNSEQCTAYLQTKRFKIPDLEQTPKKTKQYLDKRDGFFYVITPGTINRNKVGQTIQSHDDVLKLESGTIVSIALLGDRKEITGDILNGVKRDDEKYIELNVTKTDTDYYPVNSTIIIENAPQGGIDTTGKTDIQIKKRVNDLYPKPGFLYVNTPIESQNGSGYKRRQSKRKRSLRRRYTTKRSNIRRRSKKNNKRTRTRKYRKSSHHR